VPWKLVHNHPACRRGEWAVVNQQAEAEGRHSIEGCHPTRERALAQQRALYANEPQANSHEGQTMERKQLLAPVEWKAASADPGMLEGHVSVFGNVDLGGDVVMPGAFKKTLADWARSKRRIPLLVDHKMSTEGVIGSLDYAEEDAVGLRIGARFSSIQKAQDIRTLLHEHHIDGLSFTYEPIRSRPGTKGGQQVRYLDELRIFESTVTPFPMNVLATPSLVKAAAAVVDDEPDAGFDYERFVAAMTKALQLPAAASKAAVAVLLADYQAAGTTPGSDTTATEDDAAATTQDGPAGTAPDAAAGSSKSASKGTSPFVPLTPREYVDGVLQRVEQADGSPASLDALEAKIRQSLGGAV
jgi:HK97 family phage prohead protease